MFSMIILIFLTDDNKILVIAVLSLYVEKNSFAEWLIHETKDDVPLYQAVKPKKISDHWR